MCVCVCVCVCTCAQLCASQSLIKAEYVKRPHASEVRDGRFKSSVSFGRCAVESVFDDGFLFE